MKRYLLTVVTLLCASLLIAQSNERRLALVMGNADYPGGKALKNPVNDANLMASTLEDLDFDVIKRTDASLSEMAYAISTFLNKIPDYDVVLLYYAGHGIQVGGENYLIPVDAKLQDKNMVDFEAISMSKLARKFDQNNDKINIVILDACRNDPFRSWSRGGDRGFKVIDPTSGTIIAFATSAGAVAADGQSSNGPYTAELVKNMKKPVSIEQMFKLTRIGVRNATGGTQVPQEWSKLTGDFYFTRKGQQQPVVNTNNSLNDVVITRTQLKGKVKLTSNIDGDLWIGKQNMGKVKKHEVLQFELQPGKYDIKLGNWSEVMIIEPSKTLELVAKGVKQVFVPTPAPADLIPNMVFVKGGSFLMGSNLGGKNERPVHNVKVSDFYIAKHEVTHAEFINFLNAVGCGANGIYNGEELLDIQDEGCAIGYNNGFYFKGSAFANDPRCPVISVTWMGATAYAKWMASTSGKKYRLPTEAEWEFAARSGGKDHTYSGGNTLKNMGWYKVNSAGKTQPVGTKQPNALGVYDMSGNVWEWCNDWYATDFYARSKDSSNPKGPSTGVKRICRGGNWTNSAESCRTTDRSSYPPSAGFNGLGFRLAMSK
ncbi:SUMF1/EgtB/PvdO family nonheme iron enzyme [Flammeovirgaceae bacterium SG7u.111]|nr:SUMF1/EgtB/PvdO family nonheme iron enzyme [Flammeovirgaceae bacterium SG7u.132]WPO33673.1 SUMF1/EgtB/PvdO family nonheme iron enzyme [Flammeovirgaceae bacterium SG7u.111]